MSWRIVAISQNAKLDYQLGYLVVRGQDTQKIHLSEISVLIIESTAVSLTAYLLNELAKEKVKVIFCDENRNPASEIIPYYGSHDTSAKIRKQLKWTNADKSAIWTEIVRDKIKKQAQLLQKKGYEKSYLMLIQYSQDVEYGDATNREGHAAKVYFNTLFGNDFSRTDDSPLNAALNYGYSLLLALFNREIVSNGYLTQVGIFHDNMFNKYNLGSDLMEPFRPMVDSLVYAMNPVAFETEQKHEMLELFNKMVLIKNRKEYLENAVRIYVKSVFDALNDHDVSLISFYEYEL